MFFKLADQPAQVASGEVQFLGHLQRGADAVAVLLGQAAHGFHVLGDFGGGRRLLPQHIGHAGGGFRHFLVGAADGLQPLGRHLYRRFGDVHLVHRCLDVGQRFA